MSQTMMNVAELEQISEKLEKIKQALDSRFEKDSNLYLRKEGIDKIKKSLGNGYYQDINALAQKFNQKIVAKVLLKNSWLVDLKKHKSSKQSLKSLFNSVDDDFFLQIAANVIEDRSYSTVEFKEFIENMYYPKLDPRVCYNLYRDPKVKDRVRVACFEAYICKDYSVFNSVLSTLRFIDSELKNSTIEPMVNHNLLVDLAEEWEEEDYSEIATWIIKYALANTQNLTLWTRGLNALGAYAFVAAITYLKEENSSKNTSCKVLIGKIIPHLLIEFDYDEEFLDSIIDLFDKHPTYQTLLLRMLKPSENKRLNIDNQQAIKLVEAFREQTIFTAYHEELVKEIFEEKKEKQGFTSVEEIYNKIVMGHHNLQNKGTLNFFKFQLKQTDPSLLRDFYCLHGQDSNTVVTILSYYFACLPPKSKIRLSDFEFPEVYVDKITYFIMQENKVYGAVKEFLEKFNKTEEYKKLTAR